MWCLYKFDKYGNVVGDAQADAMAVQTTIQHYPNSSKDILNGWIMIGKRSGYGETSSFVNRLKQMTDILIQNKNKQCL